MAVTISSSLPVALVAGTGVTFDAPLVQLISTDDVYDPTNPAQTLTDLLNAISSEKLIGSATVDGTTVGNTVLFTAATGEKFIPTSLLFALTAISGSGNGPSINVGFTGVNYNDYLDSTRNTQYNLTGGAAFAPGSGFLINDVLTLTGGTVVSNLHATITVTSVSIASLTVNAPGTIYAPGNTITLAGGVFTTAGVVTVQTVKLVSAAIHSGGGGTGYDGGSPATFDVTVAGGTNSIFATVNVTTDGSGHIVTINSVSAAGSYTVLPTRSGNIVTGDDGTHHGTGLSLDLVFGVLAATIATSGVYTTEAATFTQSASSGSGTGATFNNVLYGVSGNSISAPGTYTTLPGNHVTLTGGTGTGASFDAVWSDSSGMFSDIDTIGQIVQITDFFGNGGNSGAGYVYMTGGQQLFTRVAFASTFTSYIMRVFVFGFTFI